VHKERNPFFRRGLIADIAPAQLEPAIGAFDQAGVSEKGNRALILPAPKKSPSIHHAHRLTTGHGQKLSKARLFIFATYPISGG
jgi:hypothetical protein